MKKIRKILVCFCLCFAVFALVSCGQMPLTGMPDLEDEVIGNGGQAVQKGGYLYFVDSYTSATSLGANDNNQGSVKTNALYRTKLKDDGSLDLDSKGDLNSYELVVSKVVGIDDTQIFIFDNYIYYATPNMQKDRTGELRTDLLQFCRAKLDGTNNEILYTTSKYDSSNGQYAFYKIGKSVYLVIFDGSDIIRVEVSGYAKRAVTLVSDVSKVLLPEVYDYTYNANGNDVRGTVGYVYYVRELTADDGFVTTEGKGNVLGRVAVNNADSKDERKGKDIDGTYTTYTLMSVRSDYLYVYKAKENNSELYAIKVDYASNEQDCFNSRDTDIVVSLSSDFSNKYVMPNENGENRGVVFSYGDKFVWLKDYRSGIDASVVLSEENRTIINAYGKYLYYLDGTKMYRIDSTNEDTSTNTELVFSDDNLDTSYIDFGDEFHIYYFSEYTGDSGDSQKYLKRVDLNNKVESDDDTDKGYTTELVGVLKKNHRATED